MKKILIIFLSFLLFPSLSYAGKWHTNMKKQEKKDFGRYVLKAQSKNKMVLITPLELTLINLESVPDNEYVKLPVPVAEIVITDV